MPTVMRKGFRFTNPLAVFYIVAFMWTASVAGAETQSIQTENAPALKKKIVLTQFDVADTLHVDDISNIYDGLPLMLSSRLEASGKFLTAYTGRSIPAEKGEAQREAIVQIAGGNGAQFLVSGVVVNAGIMQEKTFWNTSYSRQIEVEYSIHDGFTGAHILSRRLYAQTLGDVMVGNDKPFGSVVFLETTFGRATSMLVDSVVMEIQEALESVPFSANIVSVDKNEVVIDAGSDSLLMPGDQLVAYTSNLTPIAGLKGSVLGITDHAADMITLTQVQQQYSSGKLTEDAAKHGIKAGSIARIDPDTQRVVVARQIAEQQKIRAEQEAKAEAERLKAEQAAQAEAARIKAEQDAKAEAERIKAEKKAKAQAAVEAKKKAAQQAQSTRISAAQKARDRAAKTRAAAEARAAKQKAEQEAACADVEKKAPAEAKNKVAAEPQASQTTESGVTQTKTSAEASAGAEPPGAKKKLGIPLKLKPIKP